MSTIAVPTVQLVNGARMPRFGLGTWPMDDEQAERAVAHALDTGYRLIDTAENYGNEVGVGRGIAASSVPRSDVFVTTKFNRHWHSVDGARRAFEASAERLGVDYVDLLLIHWPNPHQDRYVEAFRGLVELLREGLVRAVGTSNFTPTHLRRVMTETGVVPDVNQIQLHPWAPRPRERAFHAEHGIATESWSPLSRADQLLAEPVVTELAERHGRTPAQIVLRWHVELGLVVVPKSGDPDRIRRNIDVFDFSLTPEEVASITALDRGQRPEPDPEVFGH